MASDVLFMIKVGAQVGHDFRFYKWAGELPIAFKLNRVVGEDRVGLIAPGYGDPQDYGDGSVFAYIKDLLKLRADETEVVSKAEYVKRLAEAPDLSDVADTWTGDVVVSNEDGNKALCVRDSDGGCLPVLVCLNATLSNDYHANCEVADIVRLCEEYKAEVHDTVTFYKHLLEYADAFRLKHISEKDLGK